MVEAILANAIRGTNPSEREALALADCTNTRQLADTAAVLRDRGFDARD